MSSAGRGSRSKRARSSGFAGVRGGGAVPGRRRRGRFFEPEDEIPEYVVGQNRMIWSQKSAARYTRLVNDASQRRREVASPRRRKMAAEAEEQKRRAELESRRKERIRNSPLKWGRDGRPEGFRTRPSSSPSAFPDSPNRSTK
ncbi:unnamed protein product, partial [Pylaiella littoralis]